MKSLSLRFTLAYLLCLFAIALFFFRFHTESLVLWPQNKALGNPRIYTDIREGGFSTAEFFESDSAIAMRATLNSGHRISACPRLRSAFVRRPGFFPHGLGRDYVPLKRRHCACTLHGGSGCIQGGRRFESAPGAPRHSGDAPLHGTPRRAFQGANEQDLV